MTSNEFAVCYGELVYELVKKGLVPDCKDRWDIFLSNYKLTEEEFLAIKDSPRKSRISRMEKTRAEELARGLRICKIALEMVRRDEVTLDDILDDMRRVVLYNYVIVLSVVIRLNSKRAFIDLGIRDLSIKYKKNAETELEAS